MKLAKRKLKQTILPIVLHLSGVRLFFRSAGDILPPLDMKLQKQANDIIG